MKNYKSIIYKDCLTIMVFPIILQIIVYSSSYLVSIFTSNILGDFTQNLLYLDFTYAKQNLIYIIICLLLTVLIIPLIELVSNIFISKISIKHDLIIFEKFLNKKYNFIKNIDVSDIEYKMEVDIIEMRVYLTMVVTNFITIPIIGLILLYKVLSINIIFGIITLIISLSKIVYPYLIRNLQAIYDLDIREYNNKIRKYEIEITSKPYVLKLLNIKESIFEIIKNDFEKFFKTTLKKSIKLNIATENVTLLLNTFSIIGVLIIGAILNAKGYIMSGQIITMIGYMRILETLFNKIIFNINKVKVLDNISTRLEMFYTDLEEDNTEIINTNLYEIKFENVCYSYGDNEVLSNVNFKIKKGDKCLIYGKNGSGKSTLLKILMGFIKEYKGSIKINNLELKSINLPSLYNIFTFVEQNPYILPISVFENIKLGNLNASNEEVEKVIKLLNLEQLKEKVVDLENSNLSGGEKQRIAIARALIKNSEVIIMDEPTNNLDNQSINILKFLIKNNSNKTFLVIEHSENLNQYFDKVLVL